MKYADYKLRRKDIAPPGGYKVKAPTGITFEGSTFSDVENLLAYHLEANGYNPEDAGPMLEYQTVEGLMSNGLNQYTEKTA